MGDPSVVMKVIKQRFARQVKRKCRRSSAAQRWLWDTTPVSVWQKRFYDFNVWSERKRIEKLRYMHRNPVKRGSGEATGTLEVEQLSGVLLWRTRSSAGKLSGVAPGDQESSARKVRGWNRSQSPTHSQRTRMSGAPGRADSHIGRKNRGTFRLSPGFQSCSSAEGYRTSPVNADGPWLRTSEMLVPRG